MGNKLKTVDAETLLSTPMSKTMFIVDGLISQGVNVISGASKIGKSWLMLWLGLQVAQGNSVWGLPTPQCDVLYLSLEDTQRRIKDRLYNLTDSAPDNLYFAVTSGLIGGGLEEQITDFLTEHANLQRETILPSEKAFAYKMKLDAIKHQGIASVQVAEKLLSVEKVADDAGESKDQVRRYIRLTYLIPELLSMVDDGKIAFNPAVELSYLDSYQQRAVLDAMALNDCTPSHAQSIRLKKLAQEGLLDDQMIYTVLAETKPNQQEQLKFKREELRKYFPSGYTEEQMRRDIIKGLELLKRQRERNRDAR